MSCKATILYKSGDGEKSLSISHQYFGRIEDEQSLSIDAALDLILSADKDVRTNIGQILTRDSRTSITPKNIESILKDMGDKGEKATLTGNTSLSDIFSQYDFLADSLSDIKDQLIQEFKDEVFFLRGMKNEYLSLSGRVTLPNGQNIFIINRSRDSVISFVNYLKAKMTIDNNLDLSGFVEEGILTEEDIDRLAIIRGEYSSIKDDRELFDTYLNYRSSLKPFEHNGEIITPAKDIQHILSKILKSTDYSGMRTDMEMHLSTLNQNRKKDSFDLKIKQEDLYETLSIYYPGLEDNISLEVFSNLSPSDLNRLLYHPENGLFVGNPKLMQSRLSSIKDNIITFTYPNNRLVRDMMNIGMDTKSFFALYNDPESGVEDGKYKGMKIYTATVSDYNKKSKQVFLVAGHPLSLYTGMRTFSSLEAAKKHIDKKYAKTPIKSNALVDIKTNKHLDTVLLETEDTAVGQVISVLDVEIPSMFLRDSTNINMLSPILNGSMDNFHSIFKDVPDIKKIDTAEKAVAFLYKIFLNQGESGILNVSLEGATSIDEESVAKILESESNRSRIAQVVNELDTSRYRNYKINSTKLRVRGGVMRAYVSEVSPEGLASIEQEAKVDRPTTVELNNAIQEITSIYGVV